MTRRSLTIGLLVVAALVAGGCGGGGGSGAEETVAGGGCEVAKADLRSTVAERDRLFVDLQLGEATKACEGELEAGNGEDCTAARADLEAAAAEETPPPDLDQRVEAAVAACVGTTITSTIPTP